MKSILRLIKKWYAYSKWIKMRRRIHILKEYLKYKRHIAYVEKRVVEVRSKICRQAVLYGTVDNVTRELYLKYNDYLRLLRPEL